MKRVGAFALSVLLVLFTLVGCGAASERSVRPVTDGFSCRIEAAYGEMTVAGTLICPQKDTVQLQFDQPSSLSGITLGYDGSRMTMELAGMSIGLAAEKVPQSALIRSLAGVLSAVPGGGELTDEGYVVTGLTGDRAYTLVFDPATGMPRSLSVPEDSLQATFSEQTTQTAA